MLASNDLMDLIPHVFLPRKLPESQHSNLFSHESSLVVMLSKSFEAFARIDEEDNILLSQSLQLFKTWTYIQGEINLESDRIKKAISHLENGNSMAIYVRAQNAALIISIPKVESGIAIISTFQVSLASANILGCETTKTIACVYPAISVEIPRSVCLESDALAEQLRDLSLNKCEIAMTKYYKAGVQNSEVRDVANPLLISEWLISTLSNSKSKQCSDQDFPCISKKVRDEVMWKNAYLPFRRSGMYMSLKVVLHLMLVKEFGETFGKFLYKSIMIEFMMNFVKLENMDMDVGMQIISKISRRICKLRKYTTEHLPELQLQGISYHNKYEDVMRKNVKLLQEARYGLDNIWKSIIETDSNEYSINISQFGDFRSDTTHLLRNSTKYFMDKTGTFEVTKYTPGSQCSPRLRSTLEFPNSSNLNYQDEVNCGIALQDIEFFVQNNLEHIPFSPTSFRDLFTQYYNIAKMYYKDDPIGYSRLILTCFKIVQVFDTRIQNIYPLYQEHLSGVSIACISNLLLPTRQSLELAFNLEEYFRKRDKYAKYPSLIGEQCVSHTSYSVRHAKKDSEMIKIRDQIIFDCNAKINSKMETLRLEREHCTELRAKFQSINCSYIKVHENTPHFYMYHASNCEKCKLKNQIENCKVGIYEKALPEEEYKQFAVVFELLIPTEIACFRDIIYTLVSEVCVQQPTSSTSVFIELWRNAPQLHEHSIRNNVPNSVHLVSTVKSYLNSHYGNQPKHVDETDDQFIINNAYNTMYGTRQRILLPSYGSTIKSVFIFKVQPYSPYQNLQWMVNSTDHSQNDVIARQRECLPNLTLEEFKLFGTLRAGHRLQWHNLYMALSQGQGSLTLKSESVLAIICQSIWEAGPIGFPPYDIYRDSHHDLKDSKFVYAFLHLLEGEINKNSKNWNEPLVLLTFILITARILILSDDISIQRVAMNLLKHCRNFAKNWITKVKELLGKMKQSSLTEVTQLRNKLIECAACSALTFAVIKPASNIIVMSSVEDVEDWIQAIVCIQENVIFNYTTMNEIKLTSFGNILRWIRTTGLSFEDRIREIIQQTNGAGNPLTMFAKTHWVGAMSRNNTEWRSVESPREQVYFSEWSDKSNQSLIIEVDILLGIFLVNGRPVGKLPHTITRHTDFVRVFQTCVFDVHTEGSGIFVTTDKTNGANYKFFTGNGNRLYIVELKNNEDLYLFPHHFFGSDIPPILVAEYSHWWNKSINYVDFRPKLFSNMDFHDSTAIKYTLDLNCNVLRDVNSNKIFVDKNRPSFMSIVKIMEKLEHPDFIHLMYCNSKNETMIELPRMNLNFQITKSGDIISTEFPHKRVAKIQKFGCLIGLKRGLVLESVLDFVDDQLVLIPHGKINIVPNSSGHQTINIDHSTLEQPPYFSYRIDQRLQRLKTEQNHLGWLYLSYLHAVTASPLPDPFTGLTGTEASMMLLQSPYCWSCEPFTKAAKDILNHISELSPKRYYYPTHLKCMQTVVWPLGLSSLAAEDAFSLLVNKLIDDSNRLEFLFSGGRVCNIKNNIDLTLRAYYRNSVYLGEQGRITEDFDSSVNIPVTSVWGTYFEINLEHENLRNVRRLADLGKSWMKLIPIPNATTLLKQLLLNMASVHGVSPDGLNEYNTVSQWLEINSSSNSNNNNNFENCFLNLYNFARRANENTNSKSKFIMFICLLAFNKISIENLLILLTVGIYPSEFCDPPPYVSYAATNENDFNRNRILSLFKNSSIALHIYIAAVKEKPNVCDTYAYYLFKCRMSTEHTILVNQQAEELTTTLEHIWPVESCNIELFNCVSHPQINISPTVMNQINFELSKWYHNYQLRLFLENVGTTVSTLTSLMCPNEGISKHTIRQIDYKTQSQFNHFNSIHQERLMLKFEDYLKPRVNFLDSYCVNAPNIFKSGQDTVEVPPFPFQKDIDCPMESFYMESTKKSWDIYHRGRLLKNYKSNDELVDLVKSYKRKAELLQREIEYFIYQPDVIPEMDGLFVGGIFPRIIPIVFLPFICPQSICKDDISRNQLCNLIGALCVIWTLEQRAIRCLRYIRQGIGMEVPLNRELMNLGHENWSPAEYPEWLLLELELDLLIRPVQINVAEQMLNPPNNQNALMQLNMGEGKTAVIIPLLVVAIANKKRLCRVTVLRSLFQVNLGRLIFVLGGLLNRRVYSFPCQRQMNIGEKEAQTMMEIHEECMLNGGVVLTRPEHRLSLQLKGYEKCRNGNFNDAKSLLRLQQWLQENVRDLLDESDEILHVKYQLIYTVGDQRHPDGADLRWKIPQAIFKLLMSHMPKIFEEFGANSIKFRPNSSNPEIFPHFRLLNYKSYIKLCELIAVDFIDGRSEIAFPNTMSCYRSRIISFLTAPSTNPDMHSEILQLFKDDTSGLEKILILRGLLGCGVLLLILTKRWRVNYGVNLLGERLMAVPFRAKDVAAEKTEFGHPDVAILFTHLCYYYSGLSDSQIEECFEYLIHCQNPILEYERWVSCIINIDTSISTITGINLLDFEQKNKYLYPALRQNTTVINFWLSQVVFPKESKQFTNKMVCTACDLCSNRGAHPVTGFSGTNDSAINLPSTISQKDLPQLQGTNGEVLNNLLLPENNNYKFIAHGTSCTNILKWVKANSMRVLLDVGALILELTNKEVAKEWLEILPIQEVDAVVYFDISNRLVVRDRRNNCSVFETSSYSGRLNRCVIYLDDVHTRGTDLKIPSGFKACVTLGTGVTKDKLVQGCMRMRMLGQGHTIHFLASEEVHNSIKQLVSDPLQISTHTILQWAMKNSCTITKDNMLYWAIAELNYAQKCSAMLIFNEDSQEDFNSASLALGDQSTDKEVIYLMDMYGGYRSEETIRDITRRYQQRILAALKVKLKNPNRNSHIVDEIFKMVRSNILQRCKKYVPNIKIFSQLVDEEQERELEKEMEEQRQVIRPRSANPHKHTLDERVKYFLITGHSTNFTEWCMKLPNALKHTMVGQYLQEEAWGNKIFVTKDFVTVIDDTWNIRDGASKFLRSPTWIGVLSSLDKNNLKFLLLLSPYEANEMIPLFRKGGMKTTLHMFTPKLGPNQETLFTKMELAIPSNICNIVWENLNQFNVDLSLFAGGLYFSNKDEQEFFCKTFGYIPRPRLDSEQEIFDNGWTCNGYIKPEFRQILRKENKDFCKFKANPSDLIRQIIIMRHGCIPEISHVSLIVLESNRPIL